MDQYDVAGILRSYSEQASHAKTTRQLKNIIKKLRKEFDLREIKIDKDEGRE